MNTTDRAPNRCKERCTRIVALDYLRVLAVIVLLFFHLGMIWVPDWQFHFKQQTNWFWLQHIMMLSSPWRMGLLWFIAGTSLYFMQQKYGMRYLLTRRSNAILLPLLFGIYCVVPIQLFVEMTYKNAIDTSFTDFLIVFYFGPSDYFVGFSSGIWHHVDVNHLWFLRSLWRFTLLLIIFYWPLHCIRQCFGCFNAYWLALFVVVVMFTMHIDDADTKRDVYGFSSLLFGFLFGGTNEFWRWLKRYLRAIVVLALVTTILYQTGFGIERYLPAHDAAHVAEAHNAEVQSAVARYWVNNIAMFSYYFAKAIVLIAILAVADLIFDKPNLMVTKVNRYVFPFYVLHQSVLIAVAFTVSHYAMSAMFSMLITLSATAFISFVLLLLCRYSNCVGALLGKPPTPGHWLTSLPAHLVIAAITLPLAFRLIGLT
ncbi:MAG: acyltransferase family protein [Alteromonas sp.]|jgi:peptidoglycan/LPS O-acetylase OafA/YrhL|uniref:acyltransferase family protein n=1 Tax=Alteromonas sp. TaxID=232 RepID=UPI0032D969B7